MLAPMASKRKVYLPLKCQTRTILSDKLKRILGKVEEAGISLRFRVDAPFYATNIRAVLRYLHAPREVCMRYICLLYRARIPQRRLAFKSRTKSHPFLCGPQVCGKMHTTLNSTRYQQPCKPAVEYLLDYTRIISTLHNAHAQSTKHHTQVA